MNEQEQESATDRAPDIDWVECPKCYREVPKHRAHRCIAVVLQTPDMHVTPERLFELLYDERRRHKETSAREWAAQAQLTSAQARCERLEGALANLLKNDLYDSGDTDMEMWASIILQEAVVNAKSALAANTPGEQSRA